MASLNKVLLIGNLTKDPEVKYLPDGAAVADLRIAVSEKLLNRTTNETVEKTCFLDVVVWRKQAETCGKYLSKGSPIFVEGRLQMDEWDAPDGGGKRSKLRVQASRVQFLSAPRNAELRDGGRPGGGTGLAAGPGPGPAADEGDRAGHGAEGDGNVGDEDNLPF